MKRHNLIFLGMGIGVLIGLWLWGVKSAALAGGVPAPAYHGAILWWLELLGPTLFIGALNMLIAPLIFASIFTGVTSLTHVREVGAIGWKTMAFYLMTTGMAAALGLALVTLIQPGRSTGSQKLREVKQVEQEQVRRDFEAQTGLSPLDAAGRPRPGYLSMLMLRRGESAAAQDPEKLRIIAAGGERSASSVIRDDLVKPLLMNPFKALVERNTLGIIFFAIVLGLACTFVGEPARPLVKAIHGLDSAMLQLTQWIMSIAPLCVMCLMAVFVATSNPMDLFESLSWYCLTILLGLFLHIAVLLAMAWGLGGIGPVRMLRGFGEAMLVGFSTRSSAATLPVSIANVIDKLRVSPKIAHFAMPLGATVNMNGTALYEGVAVAFLIQMFSGLDDVGTSMSAANATLIFVTAVLAAVGAAAVPSSGLITMAMVAAAVHLPVYYIGIILAVDAFLDMFRTVTNIFGDAVGAVVVQRLERERLE